MGRGSSNPRNVLLGKRRAPEETLVEEGDIKIWFKNGERLIRPYSERDSWVERRESPEGVVTELYIYKANLEHDLFGDGIIMKEVFLDPKQGIEETSFYYSDKETDLIRAEEDKDVPVSTTEERDRGTKIIKQWGIGEDIFHEETTEEPFRQKETYRKKNGKLHSVDGLPSYSLEIRDKINHEKFHEDGELRKEKRYKSGRDVLDDERLYQDGELHSPDEDTPSMILYHENGEPSEKRWHEKGKMKKVKRYDMSGRETKEPVRPRSIQYQENKSSPYKKEESNSPVVDKYSNYYQDDRLYQDHIKNLNSVSRKSYKIYTPDEPIDEDYKCNSCSEKYKQSWQYNIKD